MNLPTRLAIDLLVRPATRSKGGQHLGLLSTVRVYDPLSGHLTAISTGLGASSAVQQLTYQWDLLDNLTRRQDLNQTLTETFTYDTLNRLTSATLAGSAAKTYAYDSIGNITSKSDVGSYTYASGGIRPHAVLSAGANTLY